MVSNHSWIELSSQALAWNAAQYKAVIGAQRQLLMVVKGNAYGHGLAQVALMTNQIKALDWLGVFSLHEALAVRQAGGTKPILVMGDTDDADLYQAAHQNIHFVVDTLEQIEQLSLVACSTGTLFGVHIKLDTGLSRFGVSPEQFLLLADAIRTSRGLSLQGVSTHFAEKGKLDSAYTMQQFALFKKMIAALGQTVSYIHATTTIDSLTEHTDICTLARVGLGMYGYLPSFEIEQRIQKKHSTFRLRPVLAWKACIIRIKTVSAGDSVGYERTFIAPQEMQIGIVPVGYVDGFDGVFSQLRTVFWGPIALPVIGMIAMNCIVVDLRLAVGIQNGAEIVLFDERIARLIFALEAQHNMRVVLAGLNPSLKRIIVK